MTLNSIRKELEEEFLKSNDQTAETLSVYRKGVYDGFSAIVRLLKDRGIYPDDTEDNG